MFYDKFCTKQRRLGTKTTFTVLLIGFVLFTRILRSYVVRLVAPLDANMESFAVASPSIGGMVSTVEVLVGPIR